MIHSPCTEFINARIANKKAETSYKENLRLMGCLVGFEPTTFRTTI